MTRNNLINDNRTELELSDDAVFDLGDTEAGLIDAKRKSSVVPPQKAGLSPTGGNPFRALKGPCRIVKFCLFGFIIPALCIAVPLYVRYHILHEQQYPVALSDVRLLDNRVSTTWCQSQTLSGNASFNAYLLPNTPTYQDKLHRVSMTRHLVLSDDMKEYWGFYLLSGSQVHISACSRWPGASLIVIRGHKHLHNCAYIGDDSSEEEDELAQLELERLNANNSKTGIGEPVSEEVSTSRAQRLGRPKPIIGKSYDDSVRYEKLITTTDTYQSEDQHQTASTIPVTSSEALDDLTSRVEALGPNGRKALRKLAFQLEAQERTQSSEEALEIALLRRLVQQLLRESSKVNKYSKQNQKTEKNSTEIKRRESRHITEDNLAMHKTEIELHKILNKEIDNLKVQAGIDLVRARRDTKNQLESELADLKDDEDGAFEQGLSPDGIADHHAKLNESNKDRDRSNDEFWSSFSSSEEALMNCDGLILYLPLTARPSCDHPASAKITPSDTFSYVAPINGYYFFVFSSENEIQENLISVSFSLDRVIYNTSEKITQCDNSTSCSFSFDFFSSEKVVLEVPVAPGKEGPSPGDSADTISKHWNEEYLIVSTCEPRTSIYLFALILVPVFIMMVALQKL